MVIRRERVLSATPAEVWRVVSDPSRLAAWWPGVSRVEEVAAEAWTTVLVSPSGKSVRADYSLIEADEPERVLWRHELEESPFERLLSESTTEIALRAEGEAETHVRLTLDQRPRGWARFSPFQLRAAARRQVEGALEGLAELLGDRS
ncbi:MAG TPA: SRPBCC domain-containing protein [Myxococcota bacterium]|nr:SRPBCC domain-containing protein [Myxococcota bacterium]